MKRASAVDFLDVDAAIASMAESFPDAERFRSFQSAALSLFGEDPGQFFLGAGGVALAADFDGHRVLDLVTGMGCHEVLPMLQADPGVRAITFPEPIAAALRIDPGEAGFRQVERWEHLFHLEHGPGEVGPAPGGLVVSEWDEGHLAAAARLLYEVNQSGVNGLFLDYPRLPTAQGCEAILQRLRAGEHGPFMPEASFMAWSGDRLVGLTLVTRESASRTLLFEIAVRLRFRGSGLAPYLLDRLKVALRSRGYREVRFLTVGGLKAVSQLFVPAHVTSTLTDTGWAWRRVEP